MILSRSAAFRHPCHSGRCADFPRSPSIPGSRRHGTSSLLGYTATTRILIAWCELRQSFRHFRTDRMQAAEILNGPIIESRGRLLRRWGAWREANLGKGQ